MQQANNGLYYCVDRDGFRKSEFFEEESTDCNDYIEWFNFKLTLLHLFLLMGLPRGIDVPQIKIVFKSFEIFYLNYATDVHQVAFQN